MKNLAIITIGACVGLAGCYHTTYRNLGGAGVASAPTAGTATTHGSSWQHFFVYGWFPTEMVIPADDMCKSAGGVKEIRTQMNFLQGVLGAVQAFFIGVDLYSPWDGQVVCVNDPHI